MAITGICRIVFLVDDLVRTTQFFTDYGLRFISGDQTSSRFEVLNGAQVHLLLRGHPELPAESAMQGLGIAECVWSVDSEEAMQRLTDDLGRDHALTTGADGTVHFVTPFGQAVGLKVWRPRHVQCAPSPINTPGAIGRLNQPRKWISRAVPKRLHHVVWSFTDVQQALDYYMQRLSFRLTDTQKGLGVYIRADGAYEHHNIFLADANAPLINAGGVFRFLHANFELEDIDEIMIGKNHLERQGHIFDNGWGFGRHRLTSAAFLYLHVEELGGEMEYGADTDCVDDSWKPRVWSGAFGAATFIHNLPHWFRTAPEWDVAYARPDQLRFLPADAN